MKRFLTLFMLGVGCSTTPASSAVDMMEPEADMARDVSASRCDTSTVEPGTSEHTLEHDGLTRSFRVHVPPGYDPGQPLPVVFMFHGGGGSGEQLELRSSNMNAIADREKFMVIYPDGTGTIRTWNGGGCCGAAVRNDVDDVGFVAAMLDYLNQDFCVDTRRIYASGMSNGGIMSHRLACELSDRIAAIAPVAGTIMVPKCEPVRRVPVMHIHGTEDGHVPWEGGMGCGIAGVPFTSVPDTIEGWRLRNGCSEESSVLFEEGNGVCEIFASCADEADVVLCSVEGGGHSWPGGVVREGVLDCPEDGEQSTTFDASEAIWRFFATRSLPE